MDVDTSEPVVDLNVIDEFAELSCSENNSTVIEVKPSTPTSGTSGEGEHKM